MKKRLSRSLLLCLGLVIGDLLFIEITGAAATAIDPKITASDSIKARYARHLGKKIEQVVEELGPPDASESCTIVRKDAAGTQEFKGIAIVFAGQKDGIVIVSGMCIVEGIVIEERNTVLEKGGGTTAIVETVASDLTPLIGKAGKKLDPKFRVMDRAAGPRFDI